MKTTPFLYRRAESVEHAVELLSEHGDDAKVLAGGQSLIPMIALHLARPSVLVDITRIPGLAAIDVDADGATIGALARHRDVEEHPDLRLRQPVLAQAGEHVGHYPIRVRGTFGGSLAHADPASEWCVAALLLDAEVSVMGSEGARSIAAVDLFRGFLTTDLRDGEILTSVRLRTDQRATISEFSRRRGDFAIVVAAVAVTLDDGVVDSARVVLGGVDSSPVRCEAAESVLLGSSLDAPVATATGAAAAAAVDPPSDVHAAGWYRRRLVEVLVRRGVDALAAEPVPVS